MKQAPAIYAAYNSIDTDLALKYASAQSLGNVSLMDKIREQRRYLDNAFFILLWGQLEEEINQKCTGLIVAGQHDPDWEKRRLYYNLNPERIKFEDRLAMLVNKAAGKGSAWAKAITYYETRNKIAHGNSNMSGVNIANILSDLYFIQGHLTA